MSNQNGYYNQWPSGQPPNRRFLPLQGTFSGVTPQDVLSTHGPQIPQQHPTHFPQLQFIAPQEAFPQPQAHFTPLIPLSAVEDLQLPQVPFPSSSIPENLGRVPYIGSGPVVHEGYIPAPGEIDEDEYPGNEYNGLFRNRDMESSDDGSSDGDELTFEEQMQELEAKDDSELDADYSEEEALEDAGDPDEMELDVPYEDEEERIQQRKRSKPGPALVTDKAVRGKPRGRPSTRGRGGHSGSVSTRGRKHRGPGRPKGRRGPRAVADPGHEFRELQRQANDKLVANDYPAALDFAQRAIQLNPEIFDAHNVASEAFAAMGEQMKSIEVLIIGAPTKRDPELWHVIIDRINSLDPEAYPELTEDVKTALVLNCLKQIVALDIENYEARSNILEIEASLGHVSKCVKMGRKMLKLRRERRKAPDVEVLKIMAMMGTSSKKQTRIHLEKLIASFDESIESFTKRKPEDSPFDWEMINIYLDLLDKSQQYDYALRRLKSLARWKQGRSKEKYWDELEDDREYDIEDNRRITVPQFKKIKSHHARHGETLPLEIRVKLGIFRLRRSAEDFTEAMHHLEMLAPDDDGPHGIVWDYEDLFRVIGDALHATGHDKDALRFYEPLYNKQSQELTLMSYIGLHTCYVNLGQIEKADPIVPILKDWNAETVDDLVITAMFFEKQGMLAEAIQRAQILYKNKYAHRLRNLGFRAYDELRDVYDAERKKARGKHGVRKSNVKKNRNLMSKATGRDGVEDDDAAQDDAAGELPSLGPLSERPVQGLFRTKRTAKPPKGQTFLPLSAENSQPGPIISSQAKTIQGTGVPLHAIDHRFFRRKLQNLARDHNEELQAARAQHREVTASFKRLDEISEAAENGDETAVHEVLSITRELIEEYSTFDLFYSDRKEEFSTYFRRTGSNEIWRESAMMVLAVVANDVEDGATDPELKERPDEVPQEFWGIHFDKWLDAFGRYAVILAREGDDSRCFSTLDIAIQSNIVFRSKQFYHQLQLCRLVCALAVDDSYQASMAVRWLLKENPFGSDLFRLYSCVNRLCSVPEGYATGPAHKILIRYVKTMDFALLTEEERVWYNFRDRKDTAGGFQNSVNVEDVKFVRGHDPALFALYAHVLMCGGSYIAALNYYFRAFAITPDDPVLNLSIGIAYIQHAMKRLSENRQFQIQQGLAFVNRYYQLRVQDGSAILLQEAEFNRARIWHGLGLMSLAIPAYEKVIGLSERVRREENDKCTGGEECGYEDFKYEAAFAIQSIYAISGNLEGARKITEEVLVLE